MTNSTTSGSSSAFRADKGMVKLSVEQSNEILEKAATDFDFDSVIAAVSGGKDSQTALDVAQRSPHISLDGIIFIDTGVAVPDIIEWVVDEGEKRDLDVYIAGDEYRPLEADFPSLCKVFGAPGPPVHNRMYQNLKEKPLHNCIRENFDGDVGIISGVMRSESDRRKMNIGENPFDDDDNSPITWISPLIYWDAGTVRAYRNQYNLSVSDISSALEVSGDCLCGSFGDRFELIELLEWAPETATHLIELEKELVARAQQGLIKPSYALWAHGRETQEELKENESETEQMILCGDCEQRCVEPYIPRDNHRTVAESHLFTEYRGGCHGA